MPNEISAEDVLSEALARIEFKLDLLLKHHKVPQMEMHFPGQQCPSCGWIIDYQINLAKNVVVRKCKCSTGKLVPSISLQPVPTGVNTNARNLTNEQADEREVRTKDRSRG